MRLGTWYIKERMPLLNPVQREAIAYLKGHKLVKSIRLSYYNIKVVFADGLTERWMLNKKNYKVKRIWMPRDNLLLHQIGTYAEYETRPFDEEWNRLTKPHFAVPYHDFTRAGFVDFRLKMHEIVYNMLQSGYQRHIYPDELLLADWKKLKDANCDRYAPKPDFVNPYGGMKTPGYMINLNYMLDPGNYQFGKRVCLADAWRRPKVLFEAVKHCIKSRKDITWMTLTRAICSSIRHHNRVYGFAFVSPLYYKAIFTRILKIDNPTVIDFTPEGGSLLMGTSLVGGKYIYAPSTSVEGQVAGLTHLVGAKTERLSDQKGDIGFVGWRPKTVEDAIALIHKHKPQVQNLLIPANPWKAEEIAAQIKPKKILKARLSARQHRVLDSILVY